MMPSNRNSNRTLIPQAKRALNQMKYEIANELNIPSNVTQTGYWGDLSAHDCGAVGGEMVRRMIQAAQASLAASTGASVSQGFQSVMSPTTGVTGSTGYSTLYGAGFQGSVTNPSGFNSTTNSNYPGTSL